MTKPAPLALIDLEIGNLRSVREAFGRVGAATMVVRDADELPPAGAVVLPGVGAFGDGMEALRRRGLDQALRRAVLEEERPLLGICLGMHLLAESGEEHGHETGLGVIDGHVTRLSPDDERLRVPNMGWRDVVVSDRRGWLPATAHGAAFYFAHSYALRCADERDILARIDYGGPVPALVQRGTAVGVQFHPEKSQDAGLDLLAAFAKRA